MYIISFRSFKLEEKLNLQQTVCSPDKTADFWIYDPLIIADKNKYQIADRKFLIQIRWNKLIQTSNSLHTTELLTSN